MAALQPSEMKNNFTFDFFAKGIIYPFYTNVHNKTTSEDYINNAKGDCMSLNDVTIVRNVPPYFDARLKTSFNCFKIYHRDGFLANLKGYPDLDAYMKVQLKPKSRSRMRGQLRRLETCFPIQYKMYFGEISRANYDFLFKKLHEMIERRFSQRGDTHQSIEHWDYLRKNVFNMILERKASLFVIYDANKPIDICLNYHHQNIFRNYIRSYDIDYSKFRLGYLDIWKQLEWCFQNNHLIFDLSYGELAYKRTLCNTIYKFEQHIIYTKSHLYQKAKATIITKLLGLKWFLESKKVLRSYRLLRFKFKTTSTAKINEKLDFLTEDISAIDLNTFVLTEIDIHNHKYAFLRKAIYDFQYTNFERSNMVNIYELKDHHNTFIISGQTKKQRLVSNVSTA